MGLFRLFKQVDERDDRVLFRDNTGLHMWPPAIAIAGLIVALVCLPFAFAAHGSERENIMLVGFAGLIGSVLGVLLRAAIGAAEVDFEKRRIVDGTVLREFDDLACVVLTEGLQVVRTNNNRQELPTFRVLLGFGEADPETMERELADILEQNPSGDFIAAKSELDEQLAGSLMENADLESYELVEISAYAPMWRTSHRLASAANAALVDLTGSSFTVASGEDVHLSLAQRLRRQGYESSDLDTSAGDVDIDRNGDTLSMTWNYSLFLPMLIATLVGGGATLSFLLFTDWDAGIRVIFASIFGIPTAAAIWWLNRRSGEYKLTIDDPEVVFEPPWRSTPRRFSLDELLEVYVRPNVSGGMSVLLLLTGDEPIEVRGKLEALEAVDDAIRSHLAQRPGDE